MKKILLLTLFILISCDSNTLEPMDEGILTIGFTASPGAIINVRIKDRLDYVVKHFGEIELPTGSLNLVWDYTDDDNNRVYEGIYIVTINFNGNEYSQQIDVFNL